MEEGFDLLSEGGLMKKQTGFPPGTWSSGPADYKTHTGTSQAGERGSDFQLWKLVLSGRLVPPPAWSEHAYRLEVDSTI